MDLLIARGQRSTIPPLDNIEIEIIDGVLTLDFDRCVRNQEDITLFITLSDLEVAQIIGQECQGFDRAIVMTY